MNKFIVSSLSKSPLVPKIHNLLRWLEDSNYSLRTENSFEIFDHGTDKEWGIKAQNPLHANAFVMGVLTNRCITGLDIVIIPKYFQ